MWIRWQVIMFIIVLMRLVEIWLSITGRSKDLNLVLQRQRLFPLLSLHMSKAGEKGLSRKEASVILNSPVVLMNGAKLEKNIMTAFLISANTIQ